MLGTFDISAYIARRPPLGTERKKELSRLIGRLEKEAMNIEQKGLTQLRIQAEEYPVVNTDFLKIPNTLTFGDYKLNLPRFAVYARNNEGFCSFAVGFNRHYNTSFDYYTWKRVKLGLPFPNTTSSHLFGIPIAQSLYERAHYFEAYYRSGKLPRAEVRKFKAISQMKTGSKKKDFQFYSTFSGILPVAEKKKLKRAEEIFKNQIYLIAEVKPEDWDKNSSATDALIVGLEENVCYLVSHFSTMPWQDEIKKDEEAAQRIASDPRPVLDNSSESA